jgi:NADPH:quinone reductase-like Zn-dependent oxidoreductase
VGLRWEFDEFGGAERLQLRSAPAPEPEPEEVVVRIAFAGVNPIDRSTLLGRFPWVPRPHTPGSEATGIVHSVGEKVRGLSPGARVSVVPALFCGRCDRCRAGAEPECRMNPYPSRAPYLLGLNRAGTWSHFLAAPAHNLVELPEGLSLEVAAPLSLDGGTAWRLVDRLSPRAGDRAVVVGAAGGIGTFVVQSLVLRGVRVAAVSGRPSARSALLALGAEEVIDRHAENLADRVATWTRGDGADLVVDPTGASGFPASLALLGPGGKLGTCGITTGANAALDLLRLYSNELSVIGSTGFRRSDLVTVLELASQGRMKGVVSAVLPFDRAPEALARLEDADRIGKLLLRIDGPG